MLAGLTFFVIFLSIVNFILVVWMCIELMAMKKSTHQVQYIQPDNIAFDEDKGFDYKRNEDTKAEGLQ